MFLHYPPTNILERCSSFTDMAEEYGAEQVIYAHGQSRSRDGFTEWSIDWFPAIIWYEIQQGCYFISKMEAFLLINILLKNNLSNNWNNPIWGSNMTDNRPI